MTDEIRNQNSARHRAVPSLRHCFRGVAPVGCPDTRSDGGALERADSRQYQQPAGQRGADRRFARAAVQGARLRQSTSSRRRKPGKSHFIARLRGDGSKRPILLAAHADVVGVEREKWTRRSVCRRRQGRLCLRPRRDRLQGRDGGVRARGHDAGRTQGAARARRDLPGRGRRGSRADTTRHGWPQSTGRRSTASSR